ncbi:MAG: DNA topoisomerase IV subunit A, partial [Acholeplasmatales bacterium]|nr:DNA topoisomerase IV subunit A [Acholeplasmatales bacterium]
MAAKTKITEKIEAFVTEKISNENVTSVMAERFSRYSKYIIQDRALPNAKDGLKPVQRRILYGMYLMGLFYNKPYKKSARVVGDVMGKFHPHGDSSIYEALVRMSQDWKMLLPLIDMHGNNGSVDGDSAAAMRYTETRMSLACDFLLKDIDSNTVPFVPNFDDEELEPVVLPAKFPNLLVNGASGIATGYATNIPPHNLNEVIDACIFVIDNPSASNYDISKIVKGPDFPTGGIVQGKSEIDKAISTGSGKIIIRSKTEIIDNQIIITEIPYEVNKAELVARIDSLRLNKKVEDILEVRDESDKEGLRIAVDLKKNSDYTTILNYLYINTDLQRSYSYNIVTIINHRPVLASFLEILNAYINHQKDVVTSKTQFDLEKAKKREHIVDGLVKMVSILDEVIKIIRASSGKEDSKNKLVERWGFSLLQAEAIVMLHLYRLSNTDIVLLEKEKKELAKNIKDYNAILKDESLLLNVIKNDLNETKNILGRPRKTIIEDAIENIKVDKKDIISSELVVIGVTKEGYIKRSTLKNYSMSKETGLKDKDCLIFKKEILTTDNLLIFTSFGNYLIIPVYKIEDQKWSSIGTYISNIINIDKNENIVYLDSVTTFNSDIRFLISTSYGYSKQVLLKDLEVQRMHKTFKLVRLQEGESVVGVDKGYNTDIVSITSMGYFTRLDEREIEISTVGTRGGKTINIKDNDYLIGSFYSDKDSELVIITTRGHVLKINVSEYNYLPKSRTGFLVIERMKTNPHRTLKASNMTKNQNKENKDVLLRFQNNDTIITTQDLKTDGNKFGKKIIDINPENPLLSFTIEKSNYDYHIDAKEPVEATKSSVNLTQTKKTTVSYESNKEKEP